jgi:hypothetical protein
MSEKLQKQSNPLPENGELEAADLEKVSGGASGGTNEILLEDTPGGEARTSSNILKTKHDTVKNAISNVR